MNNPRSQKVKQAATSEQPVTDGMSRYMIRDKANVPKRVQLYDPATMEKTEDWIDVNSSLSDDFREARDEAMQNVAKIAEIPHEETRKKAAADSMISMYAGLINAWSFDKPCTTENKINFLREAPQVKNMVIAVADSNESFFASA